MPTRTGKIARLPQRLRNRLNFFLMDGKPASLILDWINVEPEAIEVFNALFSGRPVSPQNLSEWRQGGYQEWLAIRECHLDAEAFAENSRIVGHSGIKADHILIVLTARWAKLIEQWGVMDITEFCRAKHNLADLTKSAALLKKLELQTMRAELDRQRLKFLLKKKGGQPGASDYPESAADPRDNPFEYEPSPFAEKGKIVGFASVPEARAALKRLEEHRDAPEAVTSQIESPNPNSDPGSASIWLADSGILPESSAGEKENAPRTASAPPPSQKFPVASPAGSVNVSKSSLPSREPVGCTTDLALQMV